MKTSSIRNRSQRVSSVCVWVRVCVDVDVDVVEI